MSNYIKPNWPAPKNIKAYATTRCGGFSSGPFTSFNLADHVGDDPIAVAKNRQKLKKDLLLAGDPFWLPQKHTTNVVNLDKPLSLPFSADASYTHLPRQVCVVLTADCLPLLLCDKQGTIVAAIHAGWRGLAAGVIEATVDKMQSASSQLMVWLGPAIGPTAFLVGEEVYEAFVTYDSNATQAFVSVAENQWLADMYLLAKQRLVSCGITAVYGGEFCTYSDTQNFFSYRRDQEITGRMASLIWREE